VQYLGARRQAGPIRQQLAQLLAACRAAFAAAPAAVSPGLAAVQRVPLCSALPPGLPASLGLVQVRPFFTHPEPWTWALGLYRVHRPVVTDMHNACAPLYGLVMLQIYRQPTPSSACNHPPPIACIRVHMQKVRATTWCICTCKCEHVSGADPCAALPPAQRSPTC